MNLSRLCVAAVVITSVLGGSRAQAQCDGSQPKPVDDRDLAARLGVSTYDPIYFIVGANDGKNAKFQISFKYQIFSRDGWFTRCLNVPAGIYLSYTQTSLWDLQELSSPFKDTSYKPRLFYLNDSVWQSSNKKLNVALETGLGHESNGKADPESRSINIAYARPTLSYAFGQRNRFYVSPMFISYIDKGENKDINDYRGNIDLLFGFGNGNDGHHDWNGWAVLRKGDKKNYGSMELNLVVPFKYVTGDRLNGWLLMQYFNGWGESMVDYNIKATAQFRMGFAILVQ